MSGELGLCKSMYIYKMVLYSSQKTWTCSMLFFILFLNISLETWTQRVWHEIYKMHRVLKQCEYDNNNRWLVWVSVSEFNSLVAVMFCFCFGCLQKIVHTVLDNCLPGRLRQIGSATFRLVNILVQPHRHVVLLQPRLQSKEHGRQKTPI